jgi:hypothetical protein
VRSLAATQTRFAAVKSHGYSGEASLFVPSLSAAATNNVFSQAGLVIVSSIACEKSGPPKLALTTLAPLLQA